MNTTPQSPRTPADDPLLDRYREAAALLDEHDDRAAPSASVRDHVLAAALRHAPAPAVSSGSPASTGASPARHGVAANAGRWWLSAAASVCVIGLVALVSLQPGSQAPQPAEGAAPISERAAKRADMPQAVPPVAPAGRDEKQARVRPVPPTPAAQPVERQGAAKALRREPAQPTQPAAAEPPPASNQADSREAMLADSRREAVASPGGAMTADAESATAPSRVTAPALRSAATAGAPAAPAPAAKAERARGLFEGQAVAPRAVASASAPALHLAAERGDVAALRAALDAGVPVDAPDAKGRSALQVAVAAGRLEAARVLMAAGADPKRADPSGTTPLSLARELRRDEMLRLFEP